MNKIQVGDIIPSFTLKDQSGLLSVNYWGIQGFYDLFWRVLPTNPGV